jgi:hypothetical protein
MSAQVIPLRRRTVPVPSSRPRPTDGHPSPSLSPSPSPSPSPTNLRDAIRITLDDTRGVHVAVCDRCADSQSAYADSLAWLLEWAETHRCDPELVALLASVCGHRAA